ncbi:LOW QUALITY PROTEIN: Dioxygenase [Geosmithia morbida]|uniref:Dioxygenase n=1 Tax=Geosmithia morbida TaxID=1094350 RepID=A0A9P4YZ14_9HYPO|nr:LOW QUALITY PROTEIN: Dioxygenase [Geosmithia morbida]KAF4125520.1 LOW QUALITY PROTEIN: Dioxygenase [Geosmithia morbida]
MTPTHFVLATSHISTSPGYDLQSPASELFARNNPCLHPVTSPSSISAPLGLFPRPFWRSGTVEPLVSRIGVVASGIGNADDENNINKTFLRGVTQLNHNIPEYYTSHPVHIPFHTNVTQYFINTLGKEARASHVD